MGAHKHFLSNQVLEEGPRDLGIIPSFAFDFSDDPEQTFSLFLP